MSPGRGESFRIPHREVMKYIMAFQRGSKETAQEIYERNCSDPGHRESFVTALGMVAWTLSRQLEKASDTSLESILEDLARALDKEYV